MTDKPEKKRLGEMLVDAGLVTEAQIKEALKVQKETGNRLGKILVQKGIISEDNMISLLAEQLGIPRVNLSDYLIDPQIIALVPEDLARRYVLIPLFKVGDVLTVAMSDPSNVFVLDEVGYKVGCAVEPILATESEIKKVIDQYYGMGGSSIDDIAKELDEKLGGMELTDDTKVETSKLESIAGETSVIKLVNMIIMEAIRDGASDIHIEPEQDVLRTRFRVDGVLHEASITPKHLQSAIVSRIKIMSELDIAERRLPQDGRFQVKVANRNIDMRVSTFPTVHGENVVMRILDTASVLFGMEQLGLSPNIFEAYQRLIRKPYGIILVTGPTGSGKTTTLYASLNTINSIDKNIITVEDPVEYRLKLIRQCQINPKAGLTFATGLRSILRQDPDIIMVGEIRDLETAEIAIQSALTGHLVFSTLHTNDAPSSVTRLIDMGVEPFLISSSVTGVIAQRLVRKICDECKKTYKPSEKLLKELGITEVKKELVFYKGEGCKKCLNNGYRGRIGIMELMTFNEKIREFIVEKASADVLKKAAQEAGMQTMREDGMYKALNGVTTIEEVLRVTQEI
ncbi:MAG: type IV-A pilus assembly ATPase PilB [bacterium]